MAMGPNMMGGGMGGDPFAGMQNNFSGPRFGWGQNAGYGTGKPGEHHLWRSPNMMSMFRRRGMGQPNEQQGMQSPYASIGQPYGNGLLGK